LKYYQLTRGSNVKVCIEHNKRGFTKNGRPRIAWIHESEVSKNIVCLRTSRHYNADQRMRLFDAYFQA